MNKRGFTIVELLIVIVVIAILAAISIVAYNGIQNRAYDTAVKNDLASLGKKMEIYKINSSSGIYPFGGAFNSLGSTDQVTVSKNAYITTGVSYNMLNCTQGGGAKYAVLATSKSGKKFWISSETGTITEDTSTQNFGAVAACPTVLSGSSGNGAAFYASGPAWYW